MKIIIAGDGEVGFYLAQLLEKEYQDITLIDKQSDKLALVENKLGIATALGDSMSYKVLNEAGVQNADLLIAVTSVESTNIATCLIGKKLGAKFTIARINNMEYLVDKDMLDLRELGVDELVSPESLAAREVKYLLKSPVLTEVFNLYKKDLYMIGVRVEDDAPIVNKSVAESAPLLSNSSFMIAAVLRNEKTIIPTGDLQVLKGDLLYFVATDRGKDKVLEYAGKKIIQIKNILVIGGSKTGKYIALRLGKYYNIKLIEKNLEKCNYLAKTIPNVQYVCGDGADVGLLEEEGISNFDAVIAVTGSAETNIFSCLLAKDLGVKKTIAMVENIGLFDYSHKLGVDTLINKKMAAANFVFRHILKGRVLTQLHGINVEIQELIVKENSKIINKPIKELIFPENAIISGVIRDGKGYITLGSFELKANDTVFVCSIPESTKEVMSFFN
ncbi:MAG: Trk system potassium transport protein TrkA [Bacteroidetes bacterium GWF2_49_14]|nr:MAG: Trk system potassium transport protein TrkA [Bacteroidetes bacterium GWF2_49_14]HBB93575.1 Trk system potassium transporter TrkA [Bacteroidales bacterium]